MSAERAVACTRCGARPAPALVVEDPNLAAPVRRPCQECGGQLAEAATEDEP